MKSFAFNYTFKEDYNVAKKSRQALSSYKIKIDMTNSPQIYLRYM